jgi:hypothetical protein
MGGCSRSHEAAIGTRPVKRALALGEMNMAEKIIVAAFNDQESASRAAAAIKALKDTGASGFKAMTGTG